MDVSIRSAPDFENWKENFSRHLFFDLDKALASELTALPQAERSKFGLQASTQVELLPVTSKVIHDVSHTLPRRAESPISKTNGPTAKAVCDPFLGREEEMDALKRAWHDSMLGKTKNILLLGEAGMGKSRLIAEFVNRCADSNSVVMTARCYEAERAVSFGPIADLLETSHVKDALSTLDSQWKSALRTMAPALTTADVSAGADERPASQAQCYEAFAQLLIRVSANRPIIISIDDVQWCDRSTRALFSYLCRRRLGIALFVIAAIREAPRSRRPKTPWNSWPTIRLRELTSVEIAEYIRELAVARPELRMDANSLCRKTAGHPYLVYELLIPMISDGGEGGTGNISDSIGEFINAAIASLPCGCQRVLSVLAVIGRPTTARFLERICGTQSINHLTVLQTRGLINIRDNRVAFRHDLLREAAYRRTSPLTRMSLHRRVGDLLRSSKRRPGEVAAHYYKANMKAAAFTHALEAVNVAHARHAPNEVVYYTKLAMRADPSQRDKLQGGLIRGLQQVHRLSEARAEISSALTRQVPPNDVLELRIADLELSYTLGQATGPSVRSQLEILQPKIASKDELQSRALRLRLRSTINDGYDPEVSNIISVLRDYGTRNLLKPGGIESLMAAVRAQCHVTSSRQATEWAAPLWQCLDNIPNAELRIAVWDVLGSVLFEHGQLPGAEMLHTRALAEIKKLGLANLWPFIAANLHVALIEQGKYDEANLIFSEFARQAFSHEAVQTIGMIHANCAIMNYDIEQLDICERHIRQALDNFARFNSTWPTIGLKGMRGLIALEQGRLAEAKGAADWGSSKLRALGARLGDQSWMEILIARVRWTAKKRDGALRGLKEAIDDYQHRDTLCRLRMTLEYARLLKGSDRTLARQHAKEVFETARAINARPLADRADSLLHRL